MTTTTIVLLIVAIIAIVISFVITPGDNAEDAEEKTTPGLQEELTEADKKHLRKLTDNYVNEYSKKKIKEIVKGKVESTVNDEVNRRGAKLTEELSGNVKDSVKDYYVEIAESLEGTKSEAAELLSKVSEKEKDVKISLNLVDEYKTGLEKMKTELTDIETRLGETESRIDDKLANLENAVDAGVRVVPSDYEEEADEDEEAEEQGVGCGEDDSPVIEAGHDYSEDALVRTNETEIRVNFPTVGATDATLRADVINRTGGTVTMAGITVYSDMGEVIATDYQACSQSGGDFSITYSLRSDLGLVLERGRTYYYRFAVMNDGELFTHDSADFRTVEVDDTFAFELMQPEISENLAVVSAKVMNPSGAHATIAGCRIYTPQGALMGEQEIGIDTTDSQFTLSFDFDNDGEKLPEAKDYEFQVYIRYNGETYTSNYGSFTTLP